MSPFSFSLFESTYFIFITEGCFSWRWNLGWQRFSFALWTCSSAVFCPPRLLMRNLRSFESVILCVVLCDFLATCKISLSLVFSGLIMMCLNMVFFEFVLSGVHQASYIFKWISFKHLRSLQPLFVQVFSSALIAFSSASRIPVTHVSDLCILSLRSIGSVHFYKSYFSWLFRLDNFFWFIFKFTDSFLYYPHSATELFQLAFCSSKILFVNLNVFIWLLRILFSAENVCLSIHFKTVHLYFVEQGCHRCVKVFV